MSALHHKNGPNCPLCSEKLKQAHPYLQVWFSKRVAANDGAAHISWSYRDKENQEEAFSSGKSMLHYPHSPHNAVDGRGNPCAQALDLFWIDEDGRAVFPQLRYRALSAECEKAKDLIVWGGTFKSLGDLDHFQLKRVDGDLPDYWDTVSPPQDVA